MKYIYLTLKFLFEQNLLLFLVTFGLTVMFLFINILIDAYSSDNKKILKALKILPKCNKDYSSFAVSLPLIYQYQWQTFVKSKCAYPHDVFKFAMKKQRKVFTFLPATFVIVCLILAVYNVASGIYDQRVLYAPLCLALCLLLAVAIVQAVFKRKTANANKIFGKLICYLDAFFGKNYSLDTTFIPNDKTQTAINADELIKKVKYLRNSGVPSESAQKIANLLAEEKLDANRTVEQQRQLNLALNGLVQVLSHKDQSLQVNANKDASVTPQ